MEGMLSHICEKHSIDHSIARFSSAEDLIEKFRDYHVLFIDIEMPVENGLDAVKKLNLLKGNNRFPLIIFVTNKDNLVFPALEQYPFGFLRKTHLIHDLENCVMKTHSEIEFASKNLYRIKDGRNHIMIDLDHTMYLEKEKNYVKFITDKEIYRERTDINEKYADLQKKGFIRIHIGYLVNRRYVFEIQTNSVILTNEQCLPLSKKYRNTATNEFFEWLGRNNG